MKIIDTKGKLCPEPLILAKRGIQQSVAGETIQIVTDNESACTNLMAYLSELKVPVQLSSEGSEHTFSFTVPESLGEMPDTDAYCSPAADRGYVVAIKSENMGMGDDALGKILMRAFVNSLLAADRLPTAILLYNSGVKIAVRGTDTADSLAQLEERGIAIFACGTCVDYYEIKDQLAAGMISNMYTMTKYLSEAGHVVYP